MEKFRSNILDGESPIEPHLNFAAGMGVVFHHIDLTFPQRINPFDSRLEKKHNRRHDNFEKLKSARLKKIATRNRLSKKDEGFERKLLNDQIHNFDEEIRRLNRELTADHSILM